MPTDQVLDLSIYQPHVIEPTRCMECGRLQHQIRPARGFISTPSECKYCHEMGCEPLAMPIPFVHVRGKSIYRVVEEMERAS